jgi:putative Mn2+ efflux pump MntP
MADAMAYRGRDIRKLISLPLLFGLFQGVMPVAGYYIMAFTGLDTGIFSRVLVFLILSFIGLRIIFSFFRPERIKSSINNTLPTTMILTQAVCTSVDAFAVGVGLAAVGSGIFFPAFIIALITAAVCFSFLFFGRKLNAVFGERALLAGGIVIIIVGIKTLL